MRKESYNKRGRETEDNWIHEWIGNVPHQTYAQDWMHVAWMQAEDRCKSKVGWVQESNIGEWGRTCFEDISILRIGVGTCNSKTNMNYITDTILLYYNRWVCICLLKFVQLRLGGLFSQMINRPTEQGWRTVTITNQKALLTGNKNRPMFVDVCSFVVQKKTWKTWSSSNTTSSVDQFSWVMLTTLRTEPASTKREESRGLIGIQARKQYSMCFFIPK